MFFQKLTTQSGAEAYNHPAQRSPDKAAERPSKGGGISLSGPPPWGGPHAPQAHGGGGKSLGSYRISVKLPQCQKVEH